MAKYYVCTIVRRTTFIAKANDEEEMHDYCIECDIDSLERERGVRCDYDYYVARQYNRY